MGNLSLERLLFDPTDAASGPNVGSFVRAGSDGDLVSSTNVGGKEGLDVNVINSITATVSATDLDIRDLSHTQDSVKIGDGTDFLAINVDGSINVVQGGSYLEDSASANGDRLNAIAVVRQDVLSSSVSTDGDYGWAKIDSRGALWTAPTGESADSAADAGMNPVKIGGKIYTGASALSAITDGNSFNLAADLYRRVYINDAPNIAVKSTRVTIGASAVALPTTALAGRTKLTIQNLSNVSVYIGPVGVTTSGATTGLQVSKGQTLSLDAGQGVVYYAIAGSAGNDVIAFEQA